MEHLIKSRSDHVSMLITFSTANKKGVKPCKLLNFWLEEKSFMEVVRLNWHADFKGNPFVVFHHKIIKLKKALAQLNKATLGIFFRRLLLERKLLNLTRHNLKMTLLRKTEQAFINSKLI